MINVQAARVRWSPPRSKWRSREIVSEIAAAAHDVLCKCGRNIQAIAMSWCYTRHRQMILLHDGHPVLCYPWRNAGSGRHDD